MSQVSDWFRDNGDTRPMHRITFPGGTIRHHIGDGMLGEPISPVLFDALVAEGILELDRADERYKVSQKGFDLLNERETAKQRERIEAELERTQRAQAALQMQLDGLNEIERQKKGEPPSK